MCDFVSASTCSSTGSTFRRSIAAMIASRTYSIRSGSVMRAMIVNNPPSRLSSAPPETTSTTCSSRYSLRYSGAVSANSSCDSTSSAGMSMVWSLKAGA